MKERKMGGQSAEQRKSEILRPSPTNLNKCRGCSIAHQEQVGTKKDNGQHKQQLTAGLQGNHSHHNHEENHQVAKNCLSLIKIATDMPHPWPHDTLNICFLQSSSPLSSTKPCLPRPCFGPKPRLNPHTTQGHLHRKASFVFTFNEILTEFCR